MDPFLTIVDPVTVPPPPAVRAAAHELLVVNAAGRAWAEKHVAPSHDVRLAGGHLLHAGRRACLVEDRVNGNGASLCNVAEAVSHLTGEAGWGTDITVIQNGGEGSRIGRLAGGNKGQVEVLPGLTLYDLARWEAAVFTPPAQDLVQIAPVDMLHIPTSPRVLAAVAGSVAGCTLGVACIPVDLRELTPAMLAKWGLAYTARGDDRVIGFVEHPGSLEVLRQRVPAEDLAGCDFSFSTFRFFLSTTTLATIAAAIAPEVSSLGPGLKVDLSDHVIEAVFNAGTPAWRAKQGPALASAGEAIGRRLLAAGMRVTAVTLGRGAVSEDLGTYAALDSLGALHHGAEQSFRPIRDWLDEARSATARERDHG